MKTLYVIAGANGSGKTTFARKYCAAKDIPFLNADDIAAEYQRGGFGTRNLAAGKELLRHLSGYVHSGKTVAFETTLSGLAYARRLNEAKGMGYRIVLFYLFVDSPDVSIERIQGRVKAGGHYIPDEVVRTRTRKSICNFFRVYETLADLWFMYYNGGMEPLKVAEKLGSVSQVFDTRRYEMLKVRCEK
ncbi:AAA family ATPase [Seleniivibrio woodruffii]|uniref:Putative ABC-type ATPase n=1 Tax=Seleniivibrio woodruffii TaxID=1078050 RepID=A0A4R1K708_9BACT|nr:AAA family ATPase [Seleniivibrio woodruffii]TCK60022.1 putative ABC-type ATPase [Seleniivibrio woodruffii]TVZ35757.1 putative ABC-type ATPase [Seleniivibrio woodruffii]